MRWNRGLAQVDYTVLDVHGQLGEFWSTHLDAGASGVLVLERLPT